MSEKRKQQKKEAMQRLRQKPEYKHKEKTQMKTYYSNVLKPSKQIDKNQRSSTEQKDITKAMRVYQQERRAEIKRRQIVDKQLDEMHKRDAKFMEEYPKGEYDDGKSVQTNEVRDKYHNMRDQNNALLDSMKHKDKMLDDLLFEGRYHNEQFDQNTALREFYKNQNDIQQKDIQSERERQDKRELDLDKREKELTDLLKAKDEQNLELKTKYEKQALTLKCLIQRNTEYYQKQKPKMISVETQKGPNLGEIKAERRHQIKNVMNDVRMVKKTLTKFTQSKLKGKITITSTTPKEIKPVKQLDIRDLISFKTNFWETTVSLKNPDEILKKLE